MAKNLYEILGVPKTADAAELKKAYRKLAMEFHPDRNKASDSEEKLKEVNHAYDVLKDPQKRSAYDRYGDAAFDGSMGSGGFGGAGFEGFSGGPGFGGAFSDIFEDMFGDFMGQQQRGGRRSGSSAVRGSDIQYTYEITLEDAFRGKEATITLPVNEACERCKGNGAEPGTGTESCPSCNGAGRVRMQQGFFTIERTCPTCGGQGSIIRDACTKCGGQGRVRKEKTLKIKIPPGVDTGRRIRLSGEGESGLQGGPSGDLYVLLSIKPHKFFSREGANLHGRVPIPMTKAALGGELQVPTIDGSRSKIKIPAGTQSGQQFRLRGKGMSVLRSEARGDLFIEVQVETPVNLSRKQQDLLNELDKTLGGKAASKHSPASSGFFSKVKDLWEDLKE